MSFLYGKSPGSVLGGPWRRARSGTFPRGWRYGFLMPQFGLASSAWLPGAQERRALGLNRSPYWHVIDYAPGALASLDDEMLPTGNFVMLALMATSTQGPNSFQSQFFQVLDRQGGGARFSRVGVIDENQFGRAQNPFIWKRPYPMPDLFSLMNRTANRATVANTVQLAIYGVQEFAA